MSENTKLIQTHKKLTLIFTGVVFLVVTIIGLSLIITKYINESQIEKRDFSKEVEGISNSIIKDKNFLDNFFKVPDNIDGKKLPEFKGGKVPNRVSFYVIDSSGSIVFQNLLESPDFQDLNFPQEKIVKNGGDYVYQEQIEDNLIVFYSGIKTDIGDVFEDMILLLLLCILFSGVFYFIGNKFVGSALEPVKQNMQDMQDFVHNAGHELKTPLAVMRGNLQLMTALKDFDVELVDSSIKNVDKMNNLLEGLRELSELGKNSEKTEVFLHESVVRIFERYKLQAQEKNISLTEKISKNFKVFANENELEILLSNLISNAIRYNREGGSVKLTLNKNTLQIQDTGIGIPKEMQDKVYERFFQVNTTRSNQGFGIGLSLVKKICDANHWKIEMESIEGKGSSFRIIFS